MTGILINQKQGYIGILILVMFGALFSGCVQLQEKEKFVNELPQINKNLETALGNIYVDFQNYHNNYKWSSLMNYLTITDSMVNEMETYENEIKDEMQYLENLTNYVETSKQDINVDLLSSNEMRLLNEIDDKIAAYQSKKAQINSCLDAMKTYREFINVIRVKLQKTEKLRMKLSLIDNEINVGNYDDAISDIEKLKQIAREIQQLENQQAELGIIDYNQEVIDSWDTYIEGLEELEKYVEYLKTGDYESASYHYNIYLQKYTEVVQVSEGEGIHTVTNKVDNWYQENIGSCVNVFQEYY